MDRLERGIERGFEREREISCGGGHYEIINVRGCVFGLGIRRTGLK